ncbi:hypothetical protein C8J27_101658 [Rhodobacter aestuarii]|uniref:Uncharacterized protein n=1 Tax=Rhodobacter aestuarii TaxID=453582 RepID=A0A1N7P2Y1_9RHOB|nr:hypothetical protein [Rhodobacter aestuarii]PTV97542.1 hypothetical protein C8J27_101658 [Rhodobacter aestuarii]SIT04942.1 hypothetical protein SAMN05421580_10918 [Rhodobacter aestuarii]
MDRISGLMPQTGWSPLLSAVAPKKPPATTVEPASNAANTNSQLGADVDTSSQAQRVQELKARSRDVTLETAVLAQSRAQAMPDPDAPTGPPPTFDVTPLEAKAAELRSVPRQGTEVAYTAESEDTRAPEAEPEAAATQDAAPKEAAPEAPPAPMPSTDWQAGSDTAEPHLDVTR